MNVTVMRDRYVKGWPRHDHGERVYVLPMGQAFDRKYSSDAHFTAYLSPNERRITREALDGRVHVEMTCMVFDVDCHETHGSGEPAAEEWRRELRLKIVELDKVHPGLYFYETRGGARIVYGLAGHPVLMCQRDAKKWSQRYAVAVAYLARRFQISADPACGDWQRLYRLPQATRDGCPESWPAWGDPHHIGWFEPETTEADLAVAEKASKAFTKSISDITPCAASGEGLLFHLLRARGDIVREHSTGAYVVRCPNEDAHTSGTTGDTSTILYTPSRGKEVGAIHCMHAHCVGLRVRDWLKFFSNYELEAARKAAGIERAA